MEKVIKIIVYSSLLILIDFASARYISYGITSDYVRYARFDNDCYVLNENKEKVDAITIEKKVSNQQLINLCPKLIIESKSEVDERYKILIKMNYVNDIEIYINDISLAYDNDIKAYSSEWIDLDSFKQDEYSINLKIGNTNINDQIKVSVIIEQRD